MRLIDADKLLNRIAELFRNDDLYLIGTFIGLIEQQPTAFNVDKVVEQLEKLKEWEDVDGKAYYTMSEKQVINKAIKIVERGGLDE